VPVAADVAKPNYLETGALREGTAKPPPLADGLRCRKMVVATFVIKCASQFIRARFTTVRV
jgi:hypothetical protein